MPDRIYSIISRSLFIIITMSGIFLIQCSLNARNMTSMSAVSESEAIAALKSEIDRQAADSRFSGAVLVTKDGTPIFQAACGDEDRDRKIPNTVNTKFRFGSMGKMFTAVAVMQLVQNGKIKLTEPIGNYLPDYPNKDVANVTIHQLLTHTGGTGDIFNPDFFSHRSDLRELKDYIALYGNRGTEFAPGSRHAYSNYGYILLGRIIEVVSGQSYYAYVRDHIFMPAGMSSTDNLPEDQHVPGLAVPYTEDRSGSVQSAEDTLPFRGTSAGGGYSTVGDFLKFSNALISNKLLNAEYTGLVTTGKVDAPMPGAKYAYGFEDQTRRDGTRSIGHSGGAPGMNGILVIFQSSRYVIVVLSNLDPPAADEIERFIDSKLR